MITTTASVSRLTRTTVVYVIRPFLEPPSLSDDAAITDILITGSLLSERSEWRRYCVRSICLSVCLSVCVSVCAQRTGQSDQFKTVKATDFKFDVRVSKDSPDTTP